MILPLSKPILATVALMTFRASWNNYLLPNLMLARDQAATTLVVAVVKLQSSGGAGASQYNLMMAGTMLAMLPMLILFLCMNKMFVEGIAVPGSTMRPGLLFGYTLRRTHCAAKESALRAVAFRGGLCYRYCSETAGERICGSATL